eukprot:TRINITY_DN3733_c0_g1_i2.p1 TRINITY_DN3733_c0_g1~~TRINITY_DN3733_c0_g1_i2.p1  ORF type:complete len:176 (-),score=36.50 TRINITY_DN3733_c0_g1_i2:73-600(-)
MSGAGQIITNISSRFVRAALRLPVSIMSFFTKETTDTVLQDLSGCGEDTKVLLESGKLQLLTNQPYTEGPFGDPSEILAGWLLSARDKGFSSVFIIGEPVPTRQCGCDGKAQRHDRCGGFEQSVYYRTLVQWELKSTAALQAAKCSALCLYNRNLIPRVLADAMEAVHPNVLVSV